MRRTALVAVAATLVVLFPPASNAADLVVISVAPDQFAPLAVVVPHGVGLQLIQLDAMQPHNVESLDVAATGAPLFASRTASFGQSEVVKGVESLPTGQYNFTCSIHPAMIGILQVV